MQLSVLLPTYAYARAEGGQPARKRGGYQVLVGVLHGWQAFRPLFQPLFLSVSGLQQNCRLQLKSAA